MTAQSYPVQLESIALSKYLSTAYAYPVLSEAEELEHARAFKHTHHQEAAKILIMSHVRFVVHIAKKYQNFGVPFADLIQEGTVGLMKAVHRFDPDLGVRLASFAVHWIKSSIHEYILKNWRLVKIATTKAQRKLFFNLHRFMGEVASLNDDEVQFISETLEVPEKDVRTMELRLRAGYEVEAVDESPTEEGVRSDSMVLAGPSSIEPEAYVERAQLLEQRAQLLNQALNALDGRAQDILNGRWLSESKTTLQELAERHGISSERVRQLEKAALKQLNQTLSGVQGYLPVGSESIG